MRSDLPAELLAELQTSQTNIAGLWSIQLSDGRMIRGTEHDQDITITSEANATFAGTYGAVEAITLGNITSNTDMSVGNLEVQGAVPDPSLAESPTLANQIDVNLADIESGVLDRAPVIILICSWKHPEYGVAVVGQGYLGNIKHDSDLGYTCEVRKQTQLLAQTIIRTYSTTCNVVTFGDNRCRKNVAGLTRTGVVQASTANSRGSFAVEIGDGSSGTSPGEAIFTFRGGTLLFTSGRNAGFKREVKTDPNANGGIVQFWDHFPYDIAAGDAFTIAAGCPRTFDACKFYGNLVNNKAYGNYIPGIMAITAGPLTVEQLAQ